MPAPAQQAPPALERRKGFVVEIRSGSSIIIQERSDSQRINLLFKDVSAPKLGRVKDNEVIDHEAFAWEAREYLRKRLLGKEVIFTIAPGSDGDSGVMCHGTVYLPDKEDVSITEQMLLEGLLETRTRGPAKSDKFKQCEEAAKSGRKGKFGPPSKTPKSYKIVKNPEKFVKDFENKVLDAVVEHVGSGSQVKITTVPDLYSINLQICGIKCPNVRKGEMYAREAHQFTQRLFQKDVKVTIGCTQNNLIFGSIIFAGRNFAEEIIKEGLAWCDDNTTVYAHEGEKLRNAQKYAKKHKRGKWENEETPTHQSGDQDKKFAGIVTEISWDSLIVKSLTDGSYRKIHFSSIRFKRGSETTEQAGKKKQDFFLDDHTRYDIFDYLRKKLIGKKVNYTVDYVQKTIDGKLPDKYCCSVFAGGDHNVAEDLVQKGLAVLTYSKNDDARSPFFDDLKRAELLAEKNKKKDKDESSGPRSVRNYCGDATKSKTLLSSLKRSNLVEGIVMFVASGARFRLYLVKESVTVNFVLAGISCPRARYMASDKESPAEPFGDEALQFVKDKIMQRPVEIEAENVDKFGNIIGWLWINKENLSQVLVEEGFADVHDSAYKSVYSTKLSAAKRSAIEKKLRRWENYVEETDKPVQEEPAAPVERKVDYKTVCVTETTPDLRFYALKAEKEEVLEAFNKKMGQELESYAPLDNAYKPKKGDLIAARFPIQKGDWYRARFEKVAGNTGHLVYIDYGNKATVNLQTQRSSLRSLPGTYSKDEPYAILYGVACAALPPADYLEDAMKYFHEDLTQDRIQINFEFMDTGIPMVTIKDKEGNDPIKNLIADGYLRAKSSRKKNLDSVDKEYFAAQEQAKKAHKGSWEYGDNTEDDAKEFGLGK